MKKKTKVFSAALAFTFCMSIAAVQDVLAADVVSGKLTDAKGKPGEEIEVTFSLADNPGTTMYQIALEYDKEIFEVSYEQKEGEEPAAKVADYKVYPDFTPPNPLAEVFTLVAGDPMSTQNLTATGDLFAVTFKIKENVVPGNYEIKAGGEFYNGNLDLLSLNMQKNSSVTVECAHTSTREEVTDATCTAEGVKRVICTICNTEVSRTVIEKISHTLGEWEETAAADCTTDGSRIQKCTVCSEVINTEVIPALGHSYGEGVITKKQTCTEEGEIKYTCIRCSDEKTDKISADGHKYENSEVTKEPTCTTAGERKYICMVCKEEVTEEIPALGHKYDEAVITKKATCTEAGERQYICTVCKEEVTEEIPALGHQAEWKVIKEATETAEGLQQNVCAVCGEVLEEKVIPAKEKESEKKPEKPEESSSTEDIKKPEQSSEKDKGNTPVTGDATPFVVIGFMTVVSGAVIVIQKKKSCR